MNSLPDHRNQSWCRPQHGPQIDVKKSENARTYLPTEEVEPTHLKSLDLPVFRAELLAPHRLSFSEGLNTGLELVDLLPAKVELLAHIGQLVGVSLVRILDPLLELSLDMTERFQARNQIVVEDAEVRERLRFGLPVLLLLCKTAHRTSARRTRRFRTRSTRTGVLSTPTILSIYW